MSQQLNNLLAYTALVAEKKNNFSIPDLKAFIPTPTEQDYKTGYIRRNFAQKINDKGSSIIEIDNRYLDTARASGYYLILTIYWKIKGTEEDIKSVNIKSIKSVYEQMPRLNLYLPNLLQFARIENFG